VASLSFNLFQKVFFTVVHARIVGGFFAHYAQTKKLNLNKIW